MDILPEMNEAERTLYEFECKQRPWMNHVSMTDEELRSRLDADLGEGYTDKLFAHRYNDHWSWVCLAVFKSFYESGVYHRLNIDYLDGQNECDIMKILKQRGLTWPEVEEIMNRE